MNCGRPFFSLMLVALAATYVDAQLLPFGATATRLVVDFGFTEGALYDPSHGVEGSILFSDMNHGFIVRYDIAAQTAAIVDSHSGISNGMYFDANGYVIVATRGRRNLERRSLTDISQVDAVLATRYNGTIFNEPNDLVIDSSGGIYFTDPDYVNTRTLPDGVYYRSPHGTVTRLLSGLNHPNGIVLSPDESKLYLAVEGDKKIMSYPVTSPGTLGVGVQFARTDVEPLAGFGNGPDGLTIDPAGNVYAAVQNAVFAWSPAGVRLFSLPVAEDPTNVELGGRNRKTLYITAGQSLYSVGLNVLPKLPGDFDYDGDVDAADLAPWRTGFGQTGAALDADANGDGAVGGVDFLIWQRRVDATSAAPLDAAVPEPSSGALMALAEWGFGMRRRGAPSRGWIRTRLRAS